jgi:hypothetical protein
MFVVIFPEKRQKKAAREGTEAAYLNDRGAIIRGGILPHYKAIKVPSV